jgi:hypothetical protein
MARTNDTTGAASGKAALWEKYAALDDAADAAFAQDFSGERAISDDAKAVITSLVLACDGTEAQAEAAWRLIGPPERLPLSRAIQIALDDRPPRESSMRPIGDMEAKLAAMETKLAELEADGNVIAAKELREANEVRRSQIRAALESLDDPRARGAVDVASDAAARGSVTSSAIATGWPGDPAPREEIAVVSIEPALARAELLALLFDSDVSSEQGAASFRSRVRRRRRVPSAEEPSDDRIRTVQRILRACEAALRSDDERVWHACSRAADALRTDEIRYTGVLEAVEQFLEYRDFVRLRSDRVDAAALVQSRAQQTVRWLGDIDAAFAKLRVEDFLQVVDDQVILDDGGGRGYRGPRWAAAELIARWGALGCPINKPEVAAERLKAHVRASRERQKGG